MKDLSGSIFGRLKVLSPSVKRRYNSVVWQCKCECGKECEVTSPELIKGKAKSCGCLRKDFLIKRNKRHGLSGTKVYGVWVTMVNRCHNSDDHNYINYGGRGIKVCDRWRFSVENFINDMGDRQLKHTIERIDNNGNYEPQNCKWATHKEQNNNKRPRTKKFGAKVVDNNLFTS